MQRNPFAQFFATTPSFRWICVAIAALALLSLSGCKDKKASAATVIPEVEVVEVQQKDVPIYGEWVATLDGYINAQIQPQVTGYLWKQNYREGDLVRKGQILFEIDPRPFEAALQQTIGQRAQAEAQLSKTTLDVKRDTPLAKQGAIPQAQLDNDIQAKAAAEATVKAAQAQVSQAQLSLGFTKVRSLVDGIAGFAKGQIGDLVGPTTLLTTVSQVDPIKAYFAISEQEYLHAASAISAAYQRGGVAAAKEPPKEIELILADGSTHPKKGRLILADRQVDVKTGTIRIAASFSNPGAILRPGQFARVRIQTSIAKNTVLVPQRCVMETQGTYQVVAVGADNKAAIRPVKVGDRVADSWIIKEGVTPGERVIVEGVQKVKEGMQVNPKSAPRESAQGK